MKLSWVWFFFLSVIGASSLEASELEPWGERDLELYPRFDYTILHYDKLDTGMGSVHRSDNAQFFTLGISGSYDVWSVEIEGSLSDTRHRNFGFEDFRITGRYRLWNDIVGDWATVTAGLTLIKAAKQSVTDLSTYHHGRNEIEFHTVIGRECSCLSQWSSRYWGVAAIGIGDHGSPWLRGNIYWEKQVSLSFRWTVFAESLWGLGGKDLDLSKPFKGYGPINHQSIDLGTRVMYLTECYGWWALEYKVRPYARNYPQAAQQVMLRAIYPFGL